MNITDDQELANQGVEPGDIESVTLVEFSLEALDPSDADLEFLEELELHVEAEGLDRVRVAFQDSFPAGQAKVDFVLDEVDLAPYAVSESMTLTTDVTGRRPEDDTTVRAFVLFEVVGTVQGARSQLEQSRE